METSGVSQAVRISESEMNHVREAADLHSRSLAGQVEHWIRLGRLVERAPGFDFLKADAALAAMDRSGEEAEFQTLVLASLNLQQDPVITACYAALGEKPGAVGYDERERLVERQADGSLQPL